MSLPITLNDRILRIVTVTLEKRPPYKNCIDINMLTLPHSEDRSSLYKLANNS